METKHLRLFLFIHQRGVGGGGGCRRDANSENSSVKTGVVVWRLYCLGRWGWVSYSNNDGDTIKGVFRQHSNEQDCTSALNTRVWLNTLTDTNTHTLANLIGIRRYVCTKTAKWTKLKGRKLVPFGRNKFDSPLEVWRGIHLWNAHRGRRRRLRTQNPVVPGWSTPTRTGCLPLAQHWKQNMSQSQTTREAACPWKNTQQQPLCRVAPWHSTMILKCKTTNPATC